jgi:hypothetical protein
MRRQDALNEQVQQRLSSDLETLASRCQPDEAKGTLWPSGELLRSVEDSVNLLIAEERKKLPMPMWKGFQLLNRRKRSLRLVWRMDKLVRRARERLKEGGESELDKLARHGGGDGKKLRGDIERLRSALSSAKAIGWEQHQSVLKWLSGSGTIKLSCGDSPASAKVICYVRTLELLVDDYRRDPLRRRSRPLLEWLARIGHPEAKSLLAFDYATASDIERKEKASREEQESHQREKQRQRTRRHRDWHRGRWLFPGDWIRFQDGADFHSFYGKRQPLPDACVGLHDSDCRSELEACLGSLSCGRKLPDESDVFYYHRTRHITRCRDCQEAEWTAQGFEVQGGWPCGDWDAGTEERQAEQKRHAKERLARKERLLK